MLKCSICKVEKEESNFYKAKNYARGYRYACKQCDKEKREIDTRYKYTEIYFYLAEHGCEFCGETNPLKLEFDHINKSTKKYNVSNICGGQYSMQTVWDEIAKCRVLCSNCHKEKTHKEQNTIPYQIHQECK